MNGEIADSRRPRVVGRDSQFKQLQLLLSNTHCPSSVVVHGSEASGKTVTVTTFLQQAQIPHVILQCRECITGRHLFETVIAQCIEATSQSTDNSLLPSSTIARCESINAFVIALEAILHDAGKFVLVLDGIDELRDAPPSLIPALCRAKSIVSHHVSLRKLPTDSDQSAHLCILFIVRLPDYSTFRVYGLPYIYFPPYSREQASAVLALDPPSIFPVGHQGRENITQAETDADNVWLWSRFCQAVWDALAKGAANDLVSFRALCERLWRPFVQPVVEGTFGTRDFSRLVVHQRQLLQDEACLEDNLIVEDAGANTTLVVHDFPYFTKWLLCAAYLASHNPAKTDGIHFMKSTERKRKKKGGGTVAGKQAKSRKISRHLLSPTAFSLDRLLAILHAILPHDYTTNIDIYSQIATLGPLRLLTRSGAYNADPLERGGKWRITFDLEFALRLSRSLDFDMADYLAE